MSFSKSNGKKPTVDCGEGLTRPEFLSQCVPRLQIERFMRDGVCRRVEQVPMYGDFTNIGSYQECLERVLAIDEHFMSLPAAVRDRFRNKPSELFDFLSDEKNRDEAVKLGLLSKKEPTLDEKIGNVLAHHFPPKEEKSE